jgi:hypothetical protein
MSRFSVGKITLRWCTAECKGTTEQRPIGEGKFKCLKCGTELLPTRTNKTAVNFDNSLEAT